jgi:hypothetical protein
MIKEKILVGDNFEDLFLTCPACKETTHPLSKCSRLLFIPKKEKIIQRFTFSRPQRRKPFMRDKKGTRKFSATVQSGDSIRTKALIFAISNQFHSPIGSPSFEQLDELVTSKTKKSFTTKRGLISKSGLSYEEIGDNSGYSLDQLKNEMKSEYLNGVRKEHYILLINFLSDKIFFLF